MITHTFFSLIFLLSITYADTINLTGTVYDQFNQPIAGAEVSLLKRNIPGTITDMYGKFKLTGDTDTPLRIHQIQPDHDVILKGSSVNVNLKSDLRADASIYDFKGCKISHLQINAASSSNQRLDLPLTSLVSGVYLTVLNHDGNKTVIRHVICEKEIHSGKVFSTAKNRSNNAIKSQRIQTTEFTDILVVFSEGTQTVRRAVSSSVEKDIVIKLMPLGVGNVTPGIPVFYENGGSGDVTTYGSVSEPEFSQGGACNYGSTKIRYYAAINVNQIPGDLKGQWQLGQICGACARVHIRTKEGDIRSTVVRIVDKCPDDNCGIDLGGAPAGEIMKDQPGRYYGEWEWVSCDGVEGVSDGPASLFVKAGSGNWWSLVQARNGSGAVLEIRVRKAGTSEWQSLSWATEAENFFKLPVELLQDDDDWELEVLWETGTTSSLRLQGKKLAVENTSYSLMHN
ncbi:MAG TPA: hypothetical protein VHO70_01080 [Chitinispirillaceae bacterium]|nr:hypothetical protein [Chitinispirillaceae bacterium]